MCSKEQGYYQSHDDDVEQLRAQILALQAAIAAKDAAIKSASGHLNLYVLFSCVGGDSYDPECADKNVRKANSILIAELTTEIIKPAGKEDQAVYDSIARNYYK